MSNTFKIVNSGAGLVLAIKSLKIENFFRSLARENKNNISINTTLIPCWYQESYSAELGESVTEMFAHQTNTLIAKKKNVEQHELVVPTLRSTALYSNNMVSVMPLMAVGLGEGKEFKFPGLYSHETIKSIAHAYKRAMEYFCNEVTKPLTVTFEVFEKRAENEKVETVTFENEDVPGEDEE